MASLASQLLDEVTAHAQSDSLEDAREICADGTYFTNNLHNCFVKQQKHIYKYFQLHIIILLPTYSGYFWGHHQCILYWLCSCYKATRWRSQEWSEHVAEGQQYVAEHIYKYVFVGLSHKCNTYYLLQCIATNKAISALIVVKLLFYTSPT